MFINIFYSHTYVHIYIYIHIYIWIVIICILHVSSKIIWWFFFTYLYHLDIIQLLVKLIYHSNVWKNFHGFKRCKRPIRNPEIFNSKESVPLSSLRDQMMKIFHWTHRAEVPQEKLEVIYKGLPKGASLVAQW